MDHHTSDDAPTPQEFAAQLIRQLLADLDTVLFEDEAAVDDAGALIVRETEAGRPRAATLALLASGALSAHRILVTGTPGLEPAQASDIGEAIVHLVPGARAQLPAILAYAERLAQLLGRVEQADEPVVATLCRTIVRFYEALAAGHDALGSRALIELRSMTVHFDAAATALADTAFNPRRVIRPDRFHDWFMQYAELARVPDAAPAQRAVATLTREGRITAVVTEDQHPLDAAAAAVRERIPGDHTTRDDALARIRALLDVIDDLRRRLRPQIGDALNDSDVYLSLVLAAATAPLDHGAGFRLSALGQIARYNQQLLRGNAAAR